MNSMTVFFIAFGLSMDACAVSISNGMLLKDLKIAHALRFGICFGAFQFMMPILGFLLGISFQAHIMSIDHWVAFGLLSLIGGKMFYESFQKEEERNICSTTNILSFTNLICLGIATSIDALAVGVSFALTNTNVLSASAIIGVVAFSFSTLGALAGKKLSRLFQKTAERFGGIILMLIGIHILLEHLVFNIG